MSNLPWFVEHDNPEQIYTQGKFLVLDFETDEENYGSPLVEDNELVLACWQVAESGGAIIKTAHTFGGTFEQQDLLDDIASVDFVVAQNVKFEAGWLKRCGLDLHDVLFYDTLLGAWVIDGNRRRPRDLGSLAKRYGVPGKRDLIAALIDKGVPTRDIPSRWLLDYCHADVEATRQVFLKQREEIRRRKQFHLVHVRNLTSAVLADMEFEGLNLDPVRVEEEYKKAVETRERIGEELAEMTGGINLGSPKQLADFLYNRLGMAEPKDYRGQPIRTPKGEPTANAKALALLKPETEEQKRFLLLYKEYNKYSSLLEKNLEYFQLTCEQKGGLFRGVLKQNAVQTHRLASSGIPTYFEGLKAAKSVQLQNIPREFKKLFWSGDDEWDVHEFDSAQLEFRVAVDMGKDKVGYEEVTTGVDVHSFTAQVLYENKDPHILAQPTAKARRQESKQYTFKPLYGGGTGSPAVVAYIEYFKDKYAGISKMQRDWAVKTADKKMFRTPYGMVFYFPNAKLQRSGYITESTNIYNFPVQGFATGEIIPIALVYFWHRTKGLPIKPFLTVHDSIIARVKKGYEEKAREIAQKSLTTDVYEFLERVYKYKFRVPLGFGHTYGRHWGEGEEIKRDVLPDGTIIDRS